MTQNNDTQAPQTSENTSKPVVRTTRTEDFLSDRRAALDHLRTNTLDLTLDFLRDNQLPVYVKNTIKNGSVLLCTMVDAQGKRQAFRIEKTWIPQQVDARYSYDTIMRSDDLKDLIFRKVIKLIHPEAAMEELKSPMAQKALSKFRSRFASDVATDKFEPIVEAGVTERMKTLVQRISVGDLSGDDAITEMMNNFISFNEADFHYLYEKFAGKSEFSELVNEIRQEAIRQEKHK